MFFTETSKHLLLNIFLSKHVSYNGTGTRLRWFRGIMSYTEFNLQHVLRLKQNGRHFLKWYLKIYFLIWKVFFILSFADVGSKGSRLQLISVCLGIGLVMNMRRAVTWTNSDWVHWRTYALPNFSGLISIKSFNKLRSRQNDRQFPYNSKCIFLNENM